MRVKDKGNEARRGEREETDWESGWRQKK